MDRIWLLIERKCAACFLRLLKRTLKLEVVNQPALDFLCVYAFWHRNLLCMTIQRMFTGVAVLVSPSKDGELIAGPLVELGYHLIRGSSSRQGSQALKEMIRLSRIHPLAITPDGPKGPAFEIKPGIMQLALMGRIPIIPINVECAREWVFNSWDRLRMPKPFSKVRVLYGDPIAVNAKADFEIAETALAEALGRST